MRILMTVAAVVAGMTLAGQAPAGFCASPASNFTAYYYQSPGGIGRAHRVRASGRNTTRGARGPL